MKFKIIEEDINRRFPAIATPHHAIDMEPKMTNSIIVTIQKNPEDKPIFRIATTNRSTHNIKLNLEPELWMELYEISIREQSSIHAVCTAVYMTKPPGLVMDGAIRFFIADYFRWAASEEGYVRVGYGASYASINCKQSVH